MLKVAVSGLILLLLLAVTHNSVGAALLDGQLSDNIEQSVTIITVITIIIFTGWGVAMRLNGWKILNRRINGFSKNAFQMILELIRFCQNAILSAFHATIQTGSNIRNVIVRFLNSFRIDELQRHKNRIVIRMQKLTLFFENNSEKLYSQNTMEILKLMRKNKNKIVREMRKAEMDKIRKLKAYFNTQKTGISENAITQSPATSCFIKQSTSDNSVRMIGTQSNLIQFFCSKFTRARKKDGANKNINSTKTTVKTAMNISLSTTTTNLSQKTLKISSSTTEGELSGKGCTPEEYFYQKPAITTDLDISELNSRIDSSFEMISRKLTEAKEKQQQMLPSSTQTLFLEQSLTSHSIGFEQKKTIQSSSLVRCRFGSSKLRRNLHSNAKIPAISTKTRGHSLTSMQGIESETTKSQCSSIEMVMFQKRSLFSSDKTTKELSQQKPLDPFIFSEADSSSGLVSSFEIVQDNQATNNRSKIIGQQTSPPQLIHNSFSTRHETKSSTENKSLIGCSATIPEDDDDDAKKFDNTGNLSNRASSLSASGPCYEFYSKNSGKESPDKENFNERNSVKLCKKRFKPSTVFKRSWNDFKPTLTYKFIQDHEYHPRHKPEMERKQLKTPSGNSNSIQKRIANRTSSQLKPVKSGNIWKANINIPAVNLFSQSQELNSESSLTFNDPRSKSIRKQNLDVNTSNALCDFNHMVNTATASNSLQQVNHSNVAAATNISVQTHSDKIGLIQRNSAKLIEQNDDFIKGETSSFNISENGQTQLAIQSKNLVLKNSLNNCKDDNLKVEMNVNDSLLQCKYYNHVATNSNCSNMSHDQTASKALNQFKPLQLNNIWNIKKNIPVLNSLTSKRALTSESSFDFDDPCFQSPSPPSIYPPTNQQYNHDKRKENNDCSSFVQLPTENQGLLHEKIFVTSNNRMENTKFKSSSILNEARMKTPSPSIQIPPANQSSTILKTNNGIEENSNAKISQVFNRPQYSAIPAKYSNIARKHQTDEQSRSSFDFDNSRFNSTSTDSRFKSKKIISEQKQDTRILCDLSNLLNFRKDENPTSAERSTELSASPVRQNKISSANFTVSFLKEEMIPHQAKTVEEKDPRHETTILADLPANKTKAHASSHLRFFADLPNTLLDNVAFANYGQTTKIKQASHVKPECKQNQETQLQSTANERLLQLLKTQRDEIDELKVKQAGDEVKIKGLEEILLEVRKERDLENVAYKERYNKILLSKRRAEIDFIDQKLDLEMLKLANLQRKLISSQFKEFKLKKRAYWQPYEIQAK